ncbi:sensor histidine kinase [Paracoccus caeni]|uniref:C4-dicarboxylate transport sensor protein DctB n=1 Tax=Paracoccus caeni TaxID=657651 RepID=A0A934W253_9RHOB|nr:ATP-binding protein [Paracoccus caeni]MBK4217439.1 sensor histidine kinase [Paracoccus caeni]
MELTAASRLPKSYGRLLIPAIAALLFALFVWISGNLAFQHYLALGYARAEAVLRLTDNALDADLARFEVVPQLIGDLDLIRALAEEPDNQALRERTNRWLERQNEVVQSADIYLVLSDGETIAASNYRKELSFVGQNFSYRPYWIDAMNGLPARFYGVGTTSGVRGYFFSAPVWDHQGRISGVLAVKADVERIEESWRNSEHRVLVTDPEGIVFLSTEPKWLYHSLNPLTQERLDRTTESRRYATSMLGELQPVSLEEHGVPILTLPDDPEHRDAGSRDYIIASQQMEEAGWTVHVLLDSARLKAEARMALIFVVLLLSLAMIGALMLRQRRARIAERLAMQRFHTNELERRVTERTADLARVNNRLAEEVSERRATEIELRAAQASLVQVGKLAALGQMSATLSHEISQPLAAARNYADSAAILIERGDFGRARENIAHILTLVDRMAAIGKHLRHAARKPDERLGAVDLLTLLDETLTIVTPRLTRSGTSLDLDVPKDLPPLRAGPTRLQQVLVNLITNAADAVEDLPDRRITLTARQEGEQVAIRVRDHGPGVPEAIADRIFDPFFSTKGVGAGLGLGLSISSNIIRDFQGQISCRNLDPGAEFTVLLPIAVPAETKA